MKDSYKTAITRKKESAPMRWLHDQDLLIGECLDYGCGKGKDAEVYWMDKYDPHFHIMLPSKKYDTITCIYVLNVVDWLEELTVMKKVKSFLKKDGVAYFVVRRDLKGDTKSQRCVKLPLPVIKETSGFCIYRMEK